MELFVWYVRIKNVNRLDITYDKNIKCQKDRIMFLSCRRLNNRSLVVHLCAIIVQIGTPRTRIICSTESHEDVTSVLLLPRTGKGYRPRIHEC